MPAKQPGKIIHTSMRGKVVDLDLLRQKNELVPAVGNAKVNARGDELGPGGKIVRTREQILQDYYEEAQGAPDEKTSGRPKITAIDKVTTESKTTENDVNETDSQWIEDNEGNFVQKKSTRSKSK